MPASGLGRSALAFAMAVITDSIVIAAPSAAVWDALVDPAGGALWRGAAYLSDWQAGSPLLITGTIGAKRIRDKGTVLRAEPPTLLSYEFLPRVSGLPDVPESYSTVTFTLMPEGDGTLVAVTHTVPPSPVRRGKDFVIGPESGEKHVAFYWRSTLPLLKAVAEGGELPLAARLGRL